MSRVGVLGGTFDPLHLGHLRAAEAVRDELGLDKVLFVPAYTPPHKKSPEVTEPAHRLRMVERALSGESFFEVSRVEIERGGPSYTIETLQALAAEAPDRELFFITGTDAFSEIRTWKSWRELLSRYSFVVHERPGFAIEDARRLVPEELGTRVIFVRKPMLDVASTEIRRSVREGHSIRFLVPDAVEAYIRENRLYR